MASPGYEPTTIDNNVCVGACFSYSIPRTQPAEPGELIGPYCDSCQPAETKCYHVNISKKKKTRKTVSNRFLFLGRFALGRSEQRRTENDKKTGGNHNELFVYFV